MRLPLMKMEYYETYYYANIISNVLEDCDDYLLSLHEWHEDRAPELFLQPFPKESVLHSFSAFIIEGLIDEQVNETAVVEMKTDTTCELWVDRALAHHGMENDGFRQWLKGGNILIDSITEDKIYDYHNELRMCGQIETLVTELANQVFFLLFSNRVLLARLRRDPQTE